MGLNRAHLATGALWAADPSPARAAPKPAVHAGGRPVRAAPLRPVPRARAEAPVELPLLVAAPPPPTARWLVAALPAFGLERCGWTSGDVAAVVAEQQGATRLVALTPAARAAGLAPRMTAAEARALVADVLLEPRDPAGEAEDRRSLQRALGDLCDRVEVTDTDEVVLEIGRTAALWGGEQATMARLRERLEAYGHRCQLALSDHPLASQALAWHHPGDAWVPPGDGARAIARLPISSLRPSAPLAEALRPLGLRDLGALARLDAASVAARFGEEGLRLHRVACGLPEPAWQARPDLAIPDRVELAPDEPLETVDGLAALLQDGLEQLRALLQAHDRAIAALELRLDLEHGPPLRQLLRVTRPTLRVDALLRLLRARLERVLLPARAVRLALWARELVPTRSDHLELLVRRETVEPLPELLARLTDVLGEDAVLRAAPADAWRPEDTWTRRPAQPARPARPDDDPVAWQEAASWRAPLPRPTLLRHPPLPVRIEADEGRPQRLRREDGWHTISRALGPERLSGGWWRPGGDFARDYWVVDLPEGTGWVFSERGQWFLHGWFD
jgi:protein ImuB